MLAFSSSCRPSMRQHFVMMQDVSAHSFHLILDGVHQDEQQNGILSMAKAELHRSLYTLQRRACFLRRPPSYTVSAPTHLQNLTALPRTPLVRYYRFHVSMPAP